jgi:flagellar biosynthetic protein FliR
MRLGPILATLPPFSFRGVSWLIRALLLTMVSLSVTPLVALEVSIQVPETIVSGVAVLVGELILGATIALGVQFFLGAFQTVGNMLAELGGQGLVDAQDDQGVSNQIEKILVWVSGALFVLVGGHRWVLSLVIETFERLPLGTSFETTDWLYELPFRFGYALSIALSVALPAAVVMIAVGIAKVWIMRSLSAWDRQAVGGPLQAIGLVWGLVLSFSAMGWVYQYELADWIDQTQRMLIEPQRWSSSGEERSVRADG